MNSLTDEQQQLVLQNKYLAEFVAYKKIRELNLNQQHWNDIIQSCYLGLCHAALKFDPSRLNKFSTYAVPVMEGYVQQELYKISWATPTHRGYLFPNLISLEEYNDLEHLNVEDIIYTKLEADLLEKNIKDYPILSNTEKNILLTILHQDISLQEIAKDLKLSRQAIHQAYQFGTRKLKIHFSKKVRKNRNGTEILKNGAIKNE